MGHPYQSRAAHGKVEPSRFPTGHTPPVWARQAQTTDNLVNLGAAAFSYGGGH